MNQLYDRIGVDYDYTRACDPIILSTIIELLKVPPNAKILDIGCGPGNYTVAMSNHGFRMWGLDISETMLQTARVKGPDVNWFSGNVNSIPLDSGIFDGCMCTLACHHFQNLQTAFHEVNRVINHGRFVILSCSHRQLRNYWLYKYFPNELELITTYMPDIDVIVDSLCSSGFRILRIDPYYIKSDVKDNFLGARFERPELYLEESFRNGMSIFANAAEAKSVEIGCAKLRADIESGEYHRYISEYRNRIGEYYFITTEKL
ncbi:MAG: methyltransferase domain-containing protein [Ruminococcus sp.]|nr:methyltransferase domain-containing protein [Ruminococcus sp.]